MRYGYRKIRVLLNREGWDVGKYLVYRLYKEEGLMLKRMKPAGKRRGDRIFAFQIPLHDTEQPTCQMNLTYPLRTP